MSSIRLATHSRALSYRSTGKGGKNRRRGKGDGEESKRELEFKEDGTQLWDAFQSSVSALVCLDF